MTMLDILKGLLPGRPTAKTEKVAERRLWMRLGVSLHITEAEEAIIFAGGGDADDVLRSIITEGRFTVDGDTYIPDTTVEEYNKEYGTDYEVGDVGFDLYFRPFSGRAPT